MSYQTLARLLEPLGFLGNKKEKNRPTPVRDSSRREDASLEIAVLMRRKCGDAVSEFLDKRR